MSFQNEHLNHLVRNGVMDARYLLKDVDHRLAGIENALAILSKDTFNDPHIRLITIRLEQTDEGALGTLLFDGRVFCTTLEPDAGDPQRNQIPAGIDPHELFASGSTTRRRLWIFIWA